MKKFELLRPLPNVEVGTIFEECIHYDDVTRITNAFSSQDNFYEFEMSIANDKTWFRELTEHDDKERHLELLAAAFWTNLAYNDGSCYGYVGLDDKRPFGNSNVVDDICDIIGLVPNTDEFGLVDYTSEQLNYAGKLYREDLIPYLKSKYALS